MVKKLKGKATFEPKGAEKRKREKQMNEAFEFWKSLIPYIIIALILLMGLFSYYIYQRGIAINANTKK